MVNLKMGESNWEAWGRQGMAQNIEVCAIALLYVLSVSAISTCICNQLEDFIFSLQKCIRTLLHS